MKYLIVGRTASGKDTIARHLQKQFNLQPVVSYTTRDIRPEEKEGREHYFIKQSDLTNPAYQEPVASTQIGDVYYFATKEEVNKKDIYIIDPNGVYELLDKMPDTDFSIMYIQRSEQARAQSFINRGQTTKDAYDKRNQAENDQFTQFEQQIDQMTAQFPNVKYCEIIPNNIDLNYTLFLASELYKLESSKERNMVFPEFTAVNIQWDKDDDITLPDSIVIPYNIQNDTDAISDYLSDTTGYCHRGFELICNYSIDELYQQVDEIDQQLTAEYKEGESTWASNLEAEKEKLEGMIAVLEEEKSCVQEEEYDNR